jgi:hypothetical protein
MRFFNRSLGALLAFAGFILSPLTWWNDLFVNLPIAYGVGWMASKISRTFFLPGLIIGYWMTNVLGLVLLYLGTAETLNPEGMRLTRQRIRNSLVVSAVYTVAVVVAFFSGWLPLPDDVRLLAP